MNNDIEELKKHIQSLTDEKLLALLEESTKVYTAAAINIAQEEAQRRGGLESIKQRISQIQENENEEQEIQKKSHLASVYSFLVHFFSSLVPPKKRYERYPLIYVIATILRVLALFLAAVGVITIVILIFNILIGRFETGIVLLLSLLYIGIAWVILLAISEILQILVDIEKNTRQSNESLSRMIK
jgi:hypothetical protein